MGRISIEKNCGYNIHPALYCPGESSDLGKLLATILNKAWTIRGEMPGSQSEESICSGVHTLRHRLPYAASLCRDCQRYMNSTPLPFYHQQHIMSRMRQRPASPIIINISLSQVTNSGLWSIFIAFLALVAVWLRDLKIIPCYEPYTASCMTDNLRSSACFSE